MNVQFSWLSGKRRKKKAMITVTPIFSIRNYSGETPESLSQIPEGLQYLLQARRLLTTWPFPLEVLPCVIQGINLNIDLLSIYKTSMYIKTALLKDRSRNSVLQDKAQRLCNFSKFSTKAPIYHYKPSVTTFLRIIFHFKYQTLLLTTGWCYIYCCSWLPICSSSCMCDLSRSSLSPKFS